MSVRPTRCFTVEAGLAAGKSMCAAGCLIPTEYCVVSHLMLSEEPPSGFLSIESVSWSTGAGRVSAFRSTRTRSWPSSTGSPHFPISVLMASFEGPVCDGTS